MSDIHTFGFVLTALSAVLLAWHWYEWRDLVAFRPQAENADDMLFRSRRVRRRTQASALIGLVGFAMVVADRIPKNAVALSAYLFGLLIVTCMILWLGIRDMIATGSYRSRKEIERVAAELRSQIADQSIAGKKSD